MSRKIVFINQATGYLTIDIINVFAPKFGKVALIAGSIRIQDVELDKKVHWSRICRYNRGNPRKKLLSWITGTIQIFFLLLFRYRRYEFFYFTIPPSAYLLSFLLPNKFTILVFDVYPDVLKIHDHNESGLIFKTWSELNRILFRRAHRVFTIGSGMADLLSSYIPGEMIKIIPLWTGLLNTAHISKQQNHWLKSLSLENKFIVQYSGNIGYTHNVEILVNIAHEMKAENDIRFLIIGRGERYNHISGLIKEYKLDNCILLPFQPDDMLIYTLSAADIGVVLLDEKTAHVSLPSKIYNLQALSIPILGISPPASELDRHLKYFNNGVCYPQSDIKGMARFILDMRSFPDKLQILAENSGKAALKFTSENAKRYYESYVSEIL